MAYEDINNRYDKSYNATKALLESQNKAKLTDLKNQESDINNRYGQLVDSLNKNKVDTQQNYYTQRNSADAVNAQNAQKMNQLAQARGWSGGELAQMNLDQNTQRANSLGALNTQENKFLGDWAMQNTNAKRDNNVALNQLANNRNLANEQYQAGLYSAQQENQAKRLAEIYAAQQAEKQKQWESEQSALQRAFQEQQQATQLASQRDIANMKNTNKNDSNDAWNAYYGLDDAMKWNFVNSAEDRQNIINALGADGYAKMYKDAQERINNNPGSDEVPQASYGPFTVDNYGNRISPDLLPNSQVVSKQTPSLASPSLYDKIKSWLGW